MWELLGSNLVILYADLQIVINYSVCLVLTLVLCLNDIQI
jgi:hypothetical protein